MDLRKIAQRALRRPPMERAADKTPQAQSYAARTAAELRFFREQGAANVLPEIYQYWSNAFLRPRMVRAGFDGPMDLFRRMLARSYDDSPHGTRRFLSAGSGDCETELALIEHLVGEGRDNFVFECFEFNADLAARARAMASDRGVSAYLAVAEVDLNAWSPSHQYDGVLANSSLHHIQNLEGLFDGISDCLVPTGTFVTSDTIGRNGHMRWPEALSMVEEYWRELPPEYRYNHQLQRHEENFINWDCSSEGFEGIRAQDILPLLIERFDFDFFAAFSNITDPFIDRSFGPNFNSERAWDKGFVDRLEARDMDEIARGRIKPTHLVAAMCVGRPGTSVMMDGLTPRFCVRDPLRAPRPRRIVERVPDSTDVAAPGSAPEADSDASDLSLEIVPSEPTEADYVVARLASEGDVVATGGEVHLKLRREIDGFAAYPIAGGRVEIGLGRLPQGELRLTAAVGDRIARAVARVTRQAVGDGADVSPCVDYSDLWWNPAEPGWGVSIHQHPSGRLVATWLGYDEAGMPTWMSLHPGKWLTRSRFEGPVLRFTGSSARSPYDPSDLAMHTLGTGALQFEGVGTGTLSLDIASGKCVRYLERMRF